MWLCALLLLAAAGLAQSPTGSIEGFIQDQTGARIPGADIVVFHEATGQKWTVAADNIGAFRLPGLPPGVYRVEIVQAGFTRKVLRNVQVSADAPATLAETLSADVVSEQVTVVATAEVLQTTRATQTATLGSQQLDALPTASRHYMHLIVGEPSVTAPLADRTGGGMNLATEPGAQAEAKARSMFLVRYDEEGKIIS